MANTFVSKVTASSEGIKNQVKEHVRNSLQAINEYVWNSIDAGAKEIKIEINCYGKTPRKMIIEDDGSGINYNKLKTDLFVHTNDSPKKKLKKDYLSLPHGKNGHGRFAFIKFANNATWKSIFLNGEGYMEFETYIHSSNLVDFKGIGPSKSEKNKTGTKVTITDFNVNQDLITHETNSLEKIKNSLLKEFYWIIKLKNLKILLNGNKINIEDICEEYLKTVKIENKSFEITLIRWKKNYCRESNYHYLNSKNEERYKTKTAISGLDDQFLHSVIIKSELFNDFSPASEIHREKKSEHPLIFKKEFEIFKELKNKANKFSYSIRRKFSESFVKGKIERFEHNRYFDKVIPLRREREYKKPQVIEVTKEVLRFAPKIFADLNEEQTLVFLSLINKLLDDDSNTLLDILKILIKPGNESSLEPLKDLLERYPLSNIVSTIKLIEDRLITLDKLKEMVYNSEHYFLESDLQKQIENHFWIFGEEYTSLVGGEEDNFNKLSEEYCKQNGINFGEYKKDLSKKQVDLFIYGKINDGKLEKNLVVEIKRPKQNKGAKGFMKIGLEEYNQIEKYSEIIRKIPLFYSPNTKEWNYFLIGADLDDSFAYDERSSCLMKNKEKHNIKLYAMSWTELLDRAKFRLEYVRKKLEGKKKRIVEKSKNKKGIIDNLDNSAKEEK